MTGELLKELAHKQALVLDNLICPYCGGQLTKAAQTKEHVIGRRFVPRGTLDGQWNLILRACGSCNGKKSDLEDDISVITMHHDAFGNSPSPEAAVDAARKKDKSLSRKTGKPVGASAETILLKQALGVGASIEFSLTGPPQTEADRVTELARLQLMGFFYFLTYKQDLRRGYWWPGRFVMAMESHRRDWGNAVYRGFMEQVVNWEPRLIGYTAHEHYGIVIRKHHTEALWSWCLEWNKSRRVIGFFGEEQAAKQAADSLPRLEVKTVIQNGNHSVRYREDVALRDEDDRMFEWTPDAHPNERRPSFRAVGLDEPPLDPGADGNRS